MPAKVLWQSGMVMHPEHLTYLEKSTYSEQMLTWTWTAYPQWGFMRWCLDQEALQVGVVKVTEICGRFPDGTIFNAPMSDPLPKPVYVTSCLSQQTIYLTLPERTASQRYLARQVSLSDSVEALVGEFALGVEIGASDLTGKVVLPFARIETAEPSQPLRLSRDDIAPYLCLPSWLREDVVCIVQELSSRLPSKLTSDAHRSLLAQAIGQWQQCLEWAVCHPQRVYEQLAVFCMELAALGGEVWPQYAPYQQDNGFRGWKNLYKEFIRLRGYLHTQRVQSGKAQLSGKNTWEIKLPQDESIVQVIIGMTEDVAENVHRIKIAAPLRLQNLTTHALPGVALQSLQQLPNFIPDSQTLRFFSLSLHHAYWPEILDAKILCFSYVGSEPVLEFTYYFLLGETHG
jgi:predicted component of type VI protein secretion system